MSRRVHILGCYRSGTTLLMELMWRSFVFSGRAGHEASLLDPPPPEETLYLSKKPPDTLRIERAFLCDPETFLIAMLRDIRWFFRHAELEQAGVPVLAGIYGTNPAGGGYQSVSPTILLAHKDANMAVGGVGIVSGMAPRGGFDAAMVEEIIAKTREFTARPPGGVATHHDATGFFTRVYDEETGVLDGLKEYMRATPAYGPEFFRAAAPEAPAFPADDL